jgi:oligopeptide transport system substrate-binding protein
MPSKLYIVVLVALVAVFTLVGAGTAQAQAPVTGGTLVYQLGSLPTGIDPVGAQGPDGVNVVNALFDSLTAWNPVTSEVEPAAAVSWEANANATVWTFHLQPGAKFSNGSPVRAIDFKVAWERLFKGAAPNPYNYLLDDVQGSLRLANHKALHLSGVSAPKASTLVVALKHPLGDFPSLVANAMLGPLPHVLVRNPATRAAFHKAPVGNGPFKLAQAWNGRRVIKLVANPGYYGTKPYIDGVTFRVMTDMATAYTKFKAGGLDVCTPSIADHAAAVSAYGVATNGFTAQPGQQTVPGPDGIVGFLSFNTKRAPLDDVKVRQAISLAFDRSAVSGFRPGGELAEPAGSVLLPGVPGYVADAWPYAALDRAQAASLLTAAGHAGGAGLPQIGMLYIPEWRALVMELKAEAATIGVHIKPVPVTWDQFLMRAYTGKFMTTPMYWGLDYPAAYDIDYLLFAGSQNLAGTFYTNPVVNAALNAARATVDTTARIAAFQAVDAQIAADAPIAPLMYGDRTTVCSARLHDATLSPMGLFDFTSVWIQAPMP